MKQIKIKSRMIALLAAVLMSSSVALAQTSTSKHIVERGETLESIAEKYGVSKDDLVKLNPDAGQFVYVGMELIVPEKKENSLQVETIPKPSQQVLPNEKSSTSYKSGLTSKIAASYLRVLYQSNSKIYGIDYGADFDSQYLTGKFFGRSDLKFGGKETTSATFGVAIGAKQRFQIGDAFLASIELTPYIGLGYMGQPKIVGQQEAKDETTFEYGALGNITIGFKICNTSKGNSTYLTAGYEIAAGRFKTKGMFENGYFSLGIITIVGN